MPTSLPTLTHLRPLSPPPQEKHFQLQAQLVHVETEAEVLAWQRQQAERERRQLRREAPTASHGGAPERPGAMDVEAAPAAAAEAQPAAAGQRQERPQASLDSSEAGSAVGASQSHNNSVGDLAEGAEDCPAAPAAAAKSVGFSGSTHLPDAVAAAAMAEVLVPAERAGPAGAPGMYGAAPPHEAFDELLLRFQAQVGCFQEEGASA